MLGELFIELLKPINLLLYLFAYGFAAIPTSYFVGRVIHGVDIRQQQGHSHTAHYVYKNVSKGSGILVFLLDGLKGFLPCGIAISLNATAETIAVIGFFAVLGHCNSLWLRFSGGHGGTTFAGAVSVIFWPAALVTVLVNFLVIIVGFGSGTASIVGSLAGACVVFLAMANKVVWLVVLAMVAVIIIRHRTKI